MDELQRSRRHAFAEQPFAAAEQEREGQHGEFVEQATFMARTADVPTLFVAEPFSITLVRMRASAAALQHAPAPWA